jgi:hypothetical protein
MFNVAWSQFRNNQKSESFVTTLLLQTTSAGKQLKPILEGRGTTRTALANKETQVALESSKKLVAPPLSSKLLGNWETQAL